MKRCIMAMALGFAVAVSPIASQSAWAVDAHHPTTQTKKTKPAKKAKPAKKRTSTAIPSATGMTMMNCPMMKRGPMMAHGPMMKSGTMNCPMMAAHDPGMMPSPQRMKMPGEHSVMMRRMHGQCWSDTDRDHGYGYWDKCQL